MDIDGKTRAKRWVLALTSLASFMVALDALVVTTALTVMARDLRASVAGMQWIVNAYNLSFALLLLTGAERRRGSGHTPRHRGERHAGGHMPC